jgi:diaminohydroxyphosphoribosylaminopyrimidine deaminase/5-amino-6-(5-phosphoribosylamino)uracil reductase
MSLEGRMQEALSEARKSLGLTHPNPAVGAVIFHGGELVARGNTEAPGGRHAEIVALDAYRETGLSPDATTELYVTLEPCSTTGRTGPCTEAIINSGIRRVIAGTVDPNPAHSGKGFEVLRASSIDVQTGILDAECQDLNLIFNWNMSRNTPLIAGKVATTIDGRTATRGGLSKWITGPSARADVHFWRRYFPAIAVGAGTVLADNPSLTARVEGQADWCPRRFVFDRNLITFKETAFNVYSDQWRERTCVVTRSGHGDRLKELADLHGVCFWELEEAHEEGGFSEFATRCKGDGIDGVYVEGGAKLMSSLLKYQHLHYLFAYRSPKLLADTSGLASFMGQEPATMEEAIHLESVRHATFGDDQLLRGFVVYPGS